ncbi:MAG: hypothetical protein IJW38_03985 [Clostridia bacterium]|nr:hypothetical protein [Clostridia bacterium]
MINESTVRPKPQNNNAKIAFLITMLLFLVGLVSYMLADKYRGVIALIAICFLTSAILFYTKYIAPVFFYDILIDSEGVPLFVVRQQTGKREVTLARIELADIQDVKMESREERKKHKTDRGVLKYNYGPTLNPAASCRIFYKSRYESSEILIEVSEEYREMLLSYSKIARELRTDETE